MIPAAGKKWSFQLAFILVQLYCTVHVSVGADTILLGQSLSLSAGKTLISKGGKFELGFFAPGSSNNFYVGIWYKNISVRTVVWIANRDKPIPQRFYLNSQLSLSSDNGNLTLFDGLNVTIWSTSSTISASSAVLLDTGNLVLTDGFSIIWQSFDYPTDTWLPGGKVGLDRTANRSQVLTSWRNLEDPSSGIFSLGMDQSSSAEFFIWRNGSEIVWRSGVWNGQIFTFVPKREDKYLYNFSYVSNEDTDYFQYNVIHNEFAISRFVMDFSGQMKQMTWSELSQEWLESLSRPVLQCDVYGYCGAFGICNNITSPICRCFPGFEPRFPLDWSMNVTSGGCLRRIPLSCTEENDGYLKLTNIKVPANSQPLAVGWGNCQFLCTNNCSCSAFAINRKGCLLWFGDLMDIEHLSYDSSGDLYVRLNTQELSTGVSGHKLPIILGVFIPLPLVICGSVLFYIWRRKLLQRGNNGDNKNLMLLDLDISSKASINNTNAGRTTERKKVLELPMFSFSSISAATHNFSASNKLGEGGFGPVYKGNLLNGQAVAVKRLSRKSEQGLEELRNETILIAKLQHRNLVRVLGGCIEQDEKILIYEYMPNKSLDSFLFDPSKQELLDWSIRVCIIEGIAQGLLYLHHYSRLRIVHRDLKASNILLDADMNPKISDFGMARIFGGKDLQANTNRIVGTYGYMSPEYAMEGRFSVKSDVFAFGVLLLEILSGKKNTAFHHSDCLSLLGYAWKLWKNERVLELIDPILQTPPSCIAVRYIHVGLLCVQESPADRPTMSEVLAMLSNENAALDSPNQPGFTPGTNPNASSGNDGVEICSNNGLTVSALEAR